MSCCLETLNIGCVSPCNAYNTGLEIANGTYKIMAYYELPITWEVVVSGGILIIDATKLSESREVVIKVFNSNNELVAFEIDNIQYDCIQLSVKYELSI